MVFTRLHINTARTPLIFGYLCAVSSALLYGCATAPANITEKKFISHIFDNNNKQFTFLAYTATPPVSTSKNDTNIVFTGINSDSRSSSQDEARAQRQSFDRQQKMNEALETQATAALELDLQKNNYCHQGYVLLERQITPERTLLRGECRELANAQDRQQFPNTGSSVIKQSTFTEY